MSQAQFSITEETLPETWKRIARMRRRAIRKELIRRVSVTVAQLVFFFVFMILAFGLVYKLGGPMLHRYIGEIPTIGVWWNHISAFLFSKAGTPTDQLLLSAAYLYLFPFCTALVPAVLLLLFYHPATPKQTGDRKQDAWQLRAMAKHAQIYAGKKENNTANMCGAFAGFFAVVFALGYLLFAYRQPSLQAEVVSQAHWANIRLFLYAVALFFCYKLLNLPLFLMLKLLHSCRVPDSIVTETEAYYSSFSLPEQPETNADPE